MQGFDVVVVLAWRLKEKQFQICNVLLVAQLARAHAYAAILVSFSAELFIFIL